MYENLEELIAAIKAHSRGGTPLAYASEELKANRDAVIAAVKQNAQAFFYANESLRNDKEIALIAVQGSGKELLHASEELRADREVVMEAIKQNGNALKYASEELRADREVVMEAVKQNGIALKYASEELRADREVVMEAVKENGIALRYASEELRTDKEIEMKAINNDIWALDYASDEVKKDNKLKLELLKKQYKRYEQWRKGKKSNNEYWRFTYKVKEASIPVYLLEKKELRNNPAFIASVLEIGADLIELFPSNLIEDKDFMADVIARMDLHKILRIPEKLNEFLKDDKFMQKVNEKKKEIKEHQEENQEQQENSKEFKNRILETTIKDLNLSSRSFNGLRRANINILQDLLHMTKQDLHRVRNLGNNSINEIILKLEEYGIVFNEDGELELKDIEETIETEDLQDEHDETKTRNSSSEQITPKDKTVKELESMTAEELQQIIANNDQTIEENNIAIKNALVKRILAQQKTISEQQAEISELSSQKKE